MRQRNRYLNFRIVSDIPISRKDAVDAIWSSFVSMWGQVGASKTGMWVMDYIPQTKNGIVKVNHNSVKQLRSAISSVTAISGARARIDVKRSSGTLRKARELL